MADNTKDETIVEEAQKRFKRCQDWESSARQSFEDDYKFANADADNGYQWPNEIRKARAIDNRPALTINKTRQHNLQIINDCRQNKAAVKVSPTGGGATKEAAEIFEGIVRHIEYISNAQSVYDTANTFQIEAGIGYWRVVTDYPNERTFDQEIYIKRVRDPLSIYLDPDIVEVDGSDARFAFVYEDRPREVFEKEYPQFKGKSPQNTLSFGIGWNSKDTVRVAEYYRRSEKKDRLISTETGVVKASDLPTDIRKDILADPQTKVRDIIEQEIEWFLIVGNEIADKKKWPGKYIPIVRVIGEETVIDGILDRKGHTRALKDPQRTYNYWTSSAVEFIALQSKTPYIAPVEAISGLETYWQSANRDNMAVLPYNSIDDTGKPIPPPARQAPPTFAPAYLQGMQVAGQELQAVSGQYESQMGEKSNERTGIAIQERQRKGDNATYHYIDHQAVAIRFTGRILIDLIPKIYDTKRIVRIVEENGDQQQIQLDPAAKQAYQAHEQQEGSEIKAIFNPSVGEYDVISEVGPAFATKREEAFNALTQIATQSPEIMQIAGDLIMKAADFPMAEELAERLKNMVPPQALGGPSPEMLKMQQQLQGMQNALQTMTQNLADEKNKRTTVEQQKEIDVYKAETDRAAVLKDVDPAIFAPMLKQLIAEAMSQGMGEVVGAGSQFLDQPQEATATN